MRRGVLVTLLTLSFALAVITALLASGRPSITKHAGMQDESGSDSACVACHQKITPGIVADWKLSKHSKNQIDCSVCHGDEHTSAADAQKAKIPTIDTCALCHKNRADQFKAGKHAFVWASMKRCPPCTGSRWR